MQNTFQILIPPKGLLLKLKKEAENPKEVLDQVLHEKFCTIPEALLWILSLCVFLTYWQQIQIYRE